MKRLSEIIATAGGLGHIPFAPGTFGSIPGWILGLLTHHILVNVYQMPFTEFLIASTGLGLVLCVIAHLSTVQMEKVWRHDDSRIVIDEVAGQYFSTVYFPVSWTYALASFALFRAFDISKPWPIRWVDRHWDHALATLVDDLIASLCTIIVLLAQSYITP